jgi:three-Cys-motif partner protein
MKKHLNFDEIGYWSEIKLDILKKYAHAYSTILSTQAEPKLHHSYIDAFAGAGIHFSRSTHDMVLGSPLNALSIHPPFQKYYLIDLDSQKIRGLRQIIGKRPDVDLFTGDCNKVLLDKVFPNLRFEDYRRGLCILDPYGLHLDWKVIQKAGEMKTIDVFLNFPVADMNRNVLWRDPEGVSESDIQRMNTFWGDESWRVEAYSTSGNLFGIPEKEKNEVIAEGFQKRLKNVAGFSCVPKPLPMRNSKGAIIYYLFFASQIDTGEKIVTNIFSKYRDFGGR